MIRFVESQRTPAGRRFAPTEETQLFPDLLTLATALTSRSEQPIAITEFAGPFGIADLVAVAPSRDLLARRLAVDVAPLTYEPDAAILTALAPRAARDVDDVASRLGWPSSSVKRRLPTLLRSGAVARTSTGRLVRHPDVVPVGRIHAFEAKVRDWRRALQQARKYRLWADTSSVVLPRLPRSSMNVEEEITRLGIGLGVDGAWVRQPRRFDHVAARRLLASELTIAALADPRGGANRHHPSPWA